MRRRLAFTLIELLVVIAIIATLAGLLIPAVGMVQSMMNNVKCGHNMSQVGMAIWAYRSDRDVLFPGRLSNLFDPDAGLQLNGLKSKLLLCPRDPKKSQDGDPKMGRIPQWTDLSYLYEPGCSWMFEASDRPLNSSQISWFFYPPEFGVPTGIPNPTWADGKKNQQRFGNPMSNPPATQVSPYGDPFPPDLFPVIRCYHHHKWTVGNDKTDRKVQNLSWNNNVFWSIPYWEHEVNSAIPLLP